MSGFEPATPSPEREGRWWETLNTAHLRRQRDKVRVDTHAPVIAAGFLDWAADEIDRLRAAPSPDRLRERVERDEVRQWTDADLLAAIGSALEVPTGMGETAFVWEAYKPEGVAAVLRQRLKEAGVLAPTSPAVALEARGGSAEKALRMALDAFDGIAQMHGLENDQPAAVAACREALDTLTAPSGGGAPS